jgi:hypothetical protein
LAKNGIIHFINSGATTLDGTGQEKDAEGNPDDEAAMGYDTGRR